MKAGIASLLIGLLGLATATYLYYQTTDLGELPTIATRYSMSDTTRMALVILEIVGAVSGFMSYKGWKVKVGLLGMGLCTLSLILLLYYPF